MGGLKQNFVYARKIGRDARKHGVALVDCPTHALTKTEASFWRIGWEEGES
jgi:hypothetical protein